MTRKVALYARRDILLGAAASAAMLSLPGPSVGQAAKADSTARTLLVTHPSFTGHDPGPGHPERADRMRALDDAFNANTFATLVREPAPLRDDLKAAITLAHAPTFYDEVFRARPRKAGERIRLDVDTVLSVGSWEAVSRAVGAGITAVDRVMDTSHPVNNAFCQVRPPGHHAETHRAMGFCVFNNIAIAALYARAQYGAERVAVVDFDVHHGNGTQAIFWSDKNLFFGSTHQMPLFPGTGAISETGVGNIFNGPLRPGDGSDAFRAVFASRIITPLDHFSPDVILVSAGFDAHKDDPLASLRLVEEDFGWATERLLDVAQRRAQGRLISMLEGGYALNALARSAAIHVKTLMDA